ncbi:MULTISPECIES: hypothetical protein [Mesobacillus]|uniref:Uncharacterized protein n=2 Tax=Mesobacillus TaxID=2675231 RepID=A0A0D6ZCM0_9BACI|nr:MULTISPECIES: hypothetical protein [Mesobacillus]KIY23035.1 hypothetical protein UB32_05125 [Mesobacillus subterraneus]MDQ0414723.1 hypothetical protein [Mesobacillus stamsii]
MWGPGFASAGLRTDWLVYRFSAGRFPELLAVEKQEGTCQPIRSDSSEAMEQLKMRLAQGEITLEYLIYSRRGRHVV